MDAPYDRGTIRPSCAEDAMLRGLAAIELAQSLAAVGPARAAGTILHLRSLDESLNMIEREVIARFQDGAQGDSTTTTSRGGGRRYA